MIMSDEQKKLCISSEPQDLPWLKDWCHNRPLEIEVGCGKGRFLLGRSLEESSHRLIGIDWSWKWMKLGIDRAIKNKRSNIRYHKGDAHTFFENMLWNNSLTACHVYFSDPWPKKKHHKRRVLSPSFIQKIYRTLVDGGCLHISTDFFPYYSYIQNSIYSSHCPWTSIRHTNKRELFFNQQTSYEKKYQQEGRPFSFIQLIK